MAMLRDRNAALRDHFAKIAVAYMRHGEELGIRWDYAMFQMVVETNALKFTGDVDWNQNNFAGIGATGGGVKGERFTNVSDGARAHIEHLMIYAGMPVENPTADRTRKVQSWGILDKWRRTVRGPVTFADIGRKWAPYDRGYASDIQSVANVFYTRYCNQPDPNPEMVAEARGTDLAPRTVATARRGLSREKRSSLGVGLPRQPQVSVTRAEPQPEAGSRTVGRTQAAPRKRGPKITILNATPETSRRQSPKTSARTLPPAETTRSRTRIASAAGAFAVPSLRPSTVQKTAPLPSRKPEASAPGPRAGTQDRAQPETRTTNGDAASPPSCRVWTASYGGQKAIIIRSHGKGALNYTVLDVNDGRADREAAAYIAAYAKGGEKIGEFDNQTVALEKAFKLCPTG